jgi:hypothetical protein
LQESFLGRAEVYLICGLLIVSLLYSIWSCAIDARRRGRSPVLVAALVIFLFPFGLFIWLIARPRLRDPLMDKSSQS